MVLLFIMAPSSTSAPNFQARRNGEMSTSWGALRQGGGALPCGQLPARPLAPCGVALGARLPSGVNVVAVGLIPRLLVVALLIALVVALLIGILAIRMNE